MKKGKLVAAIALTATLALSIAGLAACGGDDDVVDPGSTTDPAGTTTDVLVFTSDDYYTLGGTSYALTATLAEDSTVAIKGYAGSGDEVSIAEDATAAFTISGTWAEDTYNGNTGYGYKLTLSDGANTVIHTNYSTDTADHYFYYNMTTTGGTSSFDAVTVRFECHDIVFIRTIPSDYAIYEERVATYHFTGSITSLLSSSTLDLYCLGDDTAYLYVTSSGAVTYSAGTWSYDSEADEISVTIDGKTNVSQKCTTTGREGYRVYMDAGAYVYVITDSNPEENFTASSYTDEDFLGSTKYSFSYTDTSGTNYIIYSLTLSDGGLATLTVSSDTFGLGMIVSVLDTITGTWSTEGTETSDLEPNVTLSCAVEDSGSTTDSIYVTLGDNTYKAAYDSESNAYELAIVYGDEDDSTAVYTFTYSAGLYSYTLTLYDDNSATLIGGLIISQTTTECSWSTTGTASSTTSDDGTEYTLTYALDGPVTAGEEASIYVTINGLTYKAEYKETTTTDEETQEDTTTYAYEITIRVASGSVSLPF